MGVPANIVDGDGAPQLEDVIACSLIVAGMCRWPEFIPMMVLASFLLMVLRRVLAGLLASLPSSFGCGDAADLNTYGSRPLRLVAVVVQEDTTTQ